MIEFKPQRPAALVYNNYGYCGAEANKAIIKAYDQCFDTFCDNFLRHDYNFALDMIYPSMVGALKSSFEIYSVDAEGLM